MERIAIVILNWNGRLFLEQFLSGVVQHSHAPGYATEVVVADNGSTDGSVAWMHEHFPRVRQIEFAENYGFTGGYNRAFEQIDADYYLLLNSDIEVGEGWLEPLVARLASNPRTAAVMPKIKSWQARDHFEYAGACGGFLDMLGYPFCRGRLISETEEDTGQYDTPRGIFWASGAAMLIRATAWREAGGLDEHFFAHMEEIDLCWQLKRRGYAIEVEPASVVWHVGGGTLPAWSPRKTYLNFRNNMAMLYKNLPVWRFALLALIRTGTDFLRFMSYALSLKWEFCAAIFRGHRDFWRMRRRLDRRKDIGFRSVGQIYRGSIVLRYLFVSKRFGSMMASETLSQPRSVKVD